MSIEKVLRFMDRHAAKIIVAQLVSGVAVAGLFLYVGYRILTHFGIF